MPACSRLHIQPAAMPRWQASAPSGTTSPPAGKVAIEIGFQRRVERAAVDAPGDRRHQAREFVLGHRALARNPRCPVSDRLIPVVVMHFRSCSSQRQAQYSMLGAATRISRRRRCAARQHRILPATAIMTPADLKCLTCCSWHALYCHSSSDDFLRRASAMAARRTSGNDDAGRPPAGRGRCRIPGRDGSAACAKRASAAAWPARFFRECRCLRALSRATRGRRGQCVGAAAAQRRARARHAAHRTARPSRQLGRAATDPPLPRTAARASARGRRVPADARLRPRGGRAPQAHRAHRLARRRQDDARGRRSRRSLACPFVELDREIEREAGISLSEVFLLYGQAGYRRIERRCLERMLETHPRDGDDGRRRRRLRARNVQSAAAQLLHRLGQGRAGTSTWRASSRRATSGRCRATPRRWRI